MCLTFVRSLVGWTEIYNRRRRPDQRTKMIRMDILLLNYWFRSIGLIISHYCRVCRHGRRDDGGIPRHPHYSLVDIYTKYMTGSRRTSLELNSFGTIFFRDNDCYGWCREEKDGSAHVPGLEWWLNFRFGRSLWFKLCPQSPLGAPKPALLGERHLNVLFPIRW